MSIILESKKSLYNLLESIQMLSNEQFTKKISILTNSSIGEHVRHIIELYHQLIVGYSIGIVNYDARKRDLKLQENRQFAIESIQEVIQEIDKPNKPLEILSIYTEYQTIISSNYFREIIYNIEHGIHHQAIIKIGLEFLDIKMDNEEFGMAKSTILYKKECAQ